MSRAQQLDLMVSLTTSVTLQADLEKAEAYAQEYYDRAQALAAENDGLKARLRQVKAALQAEQARNLELQRALIHAESMAASWQALAELQRRTELATPRHAMPSKDVLLDLVKLCHPDKWQGQNAEVLAHELMVTINEMREGVTV